jgi:hypothetical protein
MCLGMLSLYILSKGYITYPPPRSEPVQAIYIDTTHDNEYYYRG